jgi:hypothetical protein
MEAQREVLIAFLGAFAGFSAFGAVIATFLASSNALPWLGALWGGHALQEAAEDGHAAAIGFWTRNHRAILVWRRDRARGPCALHRADEQSLLAECGTAANVSEGWEYQWPGRRNPSVSRTHCRANG